MMCQALKITVAEQQRAFFVVVEVRKFIVVTAKRSSNCPVMYAVVRVVLWIDVGRRAVQVVVYGERARCG